MLDNVLIMESGKITDVNSKENNVEINPNTKPVTRAILKTIMDFLSSLIITGKIKNSPVKLIMMRLKILLRI